MSDEVCGKKCEVFSRITGYLRPLGNWNEGKQSEYRDSKKFDVKPSRLRFEAQGQESCAKEE